MMSQADEAREIIKHIEFSKQLVNRALILLTVHLVATLVLIVVWPAAESGVLALMREVVTLYGVIFGGYYGKASIENYTKIRMAHDGARKTQGDGSNSVG